MGSKPRHGVEKDLPLTPSTLEGEIGAGNLAGGGCRIDQMSLPGEYILDCRATSGNNEEEAHRLVRAGGAAAPALGSGPVGPEEMI